MEVKVLTARDIEFFQANGYLKLRDARFATLKKRIRDGLQPMAVGILKNHPYTSNRWQQFEDKPLAEIVDWCIANEENNCVTRTFYELFHTDASIYPLAVHELFISISNELGLAHPIPSVPPVVRIDRPNESRFLEPAHQDYWYSMLSDNSVTYWFPLFPITRDMGYLEVVPGSHKAGLRATSKWEIDPRRFTLREPANDADFEQVNPEDDEMLVFSQFLIHRSGKNVGERARFTLQVRHNDLATLKSQTSSFVPKLSQFTTDAQTGWSQQCEAKSNAIRL
jgi:ectoine hydroxylase-related dioxygenase (phytanoyl-CoA dioxygenase family)